MSRTIGLVGKAVFCILVFWRNPAVVQAQIRNSSIACTTGSCGTQEVSRNTTASRTAFGHLLPHGIASGTGGNLFLSSPSTRQGLVLDSFTYLTLDVFGSLKTTAPVDGSTTEARFQSPSGAVGTSLTTFVADTLNFCIRTLDSSGAVGTVPVGTPGWPPDQFGNDGIGSSAQFDHPVALAATSDGGTIYIADGNRIRRVDLGGSELTTIAGSGAAGYSEGVGTWAEFSGPMGVALSEGNSTLFVADFHGHRIRRVSLATGTVSTLAGSPWATGSEDGQGSYARFYNPSAIAITPDEREVVVTDYASSSLRAVDVSSGSSRTLSATGPSPTALIITPDAVPYIVISREGGVERVVPRCINGFYRERNGECYACTASCTNNATAVAACNGIDDLRCE